MCRPTKSRAVPAKIVYSLLLIAIERNNALMHEKSYRPANLPRIVYSDIRGDAT